MDNPVFNENELRISCEKYNFTYHLTTNEVIIKTLYAKWKFDFTKETFDLYHRPIVLSYYNSAINTNEGYHNQNKSFENVTDLVDYIYTHDNNFYTKKKPELKKKKHKR